MEPRKRSCSAVLLVINSVSLLFKDSRKAVCCWLDSAAEAESRCVMVLICDSTALRSWSPELLLSSRKLFRSPFSVSPTAAMLAAISVRSAPNSVVFASRVLRASSAISERI